MSSGRRQTAADWSDSARNAFSAQVQRPLVRQSLAYSSRDEETVPPTSPCIRRSQNTSRQARPPPPSRPFRRPWLTSPRILPLRRLQRGHEGSPAMSRAVPVPPVRRHVQRLETRPQRLPPTRSQHSRDHRSPEHGLITDACPLTADGTHPEELRGGQGEATTRRAAVARNRGRVLTLSTADRPIRPGFLSRPQSCRCLVGPAQAALHCWPASSAWFAVRTTRPGFRLASTCITPCLPLSRCIAFVVTPDHCYRQAASVLARRPKKPTRTRWAFVPGPHDAYRNKPDQDSLTDQIESRTWRTQLVPERVFGIQTCGMVPVDRTEGLASLV